EPPRMQDQHVEGPLEQVAAGPLGLLSQGIRVSIRMSGGDRRSGWAFGLRPARAGVGGWRLEVGGRRLEVGGRRLEDGGWRTEVGGRRLEVGSSVGFWELRGWYLPATPSGSLAGAFPIV